MDPRSKPLVGMMSRPFLLNLMLAISVHCPSRAWTAYSLVLKGRRFPASLLRLRVLEARGNASVVPPLSFGLLWGGCPIARTTSNPACGEDPGSSVIDGGGTLADGYFFEYDRDPLRWVLEESRDGEWNTIGAAVWRLQPGTGTAEFFPELPATRTQFHAKSEGEVGAFTIYCDLRTPMGWVLINVILFVSNSATAFSCWVAGCLGHTKAFRLSFYSAYIIACLVLSTAAASFAWQGMWRESVSTWLRSILRAIFSCCIISKNNWLIPLLVFLGVSDIIISLFTDAALYHRTAQGFLTVGVAGFQVFFGVLMLLFRRWAIAQAHGIVERDKLVYDKLWAVACTTPDAKKALQRLQAAAEKLSVRGIRATIPRQLSNERPFPTSPMNMNMSALLPLKKQWGPRVLSARHAGQPIQSLDQLFAQAICLDPIFLRKVQAWAAASNGCFPALGHEGFVQYAQYCRGKSKVGIRWAKIKSVDRAIEKAVRVYGQDVSRLVDLCRQSIIFERLDDVSQCLEAIAADTDVRIVRVKNRLHPAYDSSASGGYRDVAVNLQISCQTSVEMGVESHIGELQLILRPFAEIKSDAGHARYVAFRNLRAE